MIDYYINSIDFDFDLLPFAAAIFGVCSLENIVYDIGNFFYSNSVRMHFCRKLQFAYGDNCNSHDQGLGSCARHDIIEKYSMVF